MAFGYTGRVLHVDLARRRLEVETPDDAFYRRYHGGRAMVAYYLAKLLKPGVDPLGPENVLIFAPGVITGAMVSGQGRNGAGAKSPLTGGFGNAEGGGFWGAECKRAGFDAVVITGRSERPVYLSLRDGEAEIRDASHLWGKTTGEAEDLIRAELGDRQVRTALIGPAGENLVRFACIVNDRSHFAGRTGLGAVMGSKNLKGLAARARPGAKLLQFKDAARVAAVQKWMARNLDLVAGLREHGTAGGLKSLSVAGGLPTRNFQQGSFAGADSITGATMTATILSGRDTCAACAVSCKRVVEMESPRRIDGRYGGPEYETLSAFGNNCGVDDLAALAKASELCAAWGLDSISTGATIAFGMECAQRGLLGPSDLGPVDLRFGSTQGMLEALEAIAFRRAVGDLLAEGVARAAAQIGRGAAEFALHVKGQELPMHEPRIKHALGIGYAVSPTGADHMHNLHDTSFTKETRWWKDVQTWEPLPTIQPHGLDETKLRMLVHHSNWRHYLDCAVMCMFLPYSPAQVNEIVAAATGWDTTPQELYEVGKRASTMARMINYREGLRGDTDRLPRRLFEPLEKSATGKPLSPEEFESARRRYYQLMGWDPDTGEPMRGELRRLGIEWMAGAT